MKRYAPIVCTLMLFVTTGCSLAFAQDASAPGQKLRYGEPVKLGVLDDPAVQESSGMAWGRRNGVIWTHNDSGNGTWLFAFDTSGQRVARVKVAGARNHDWEDMGSFTMDGKDYLLIGDIGDNAHRRRQCTLYLLEEPAIDANGGSRTPSVPIAQAIRFGYEDGAHDCEAVAVDPTSRTVILVTKKLGFWCNAYALALPEKPTDEKLTAKKLAAVEAPVVTAMDISPDGRRAVVCTYGEAWEFARGPDMTWAKAFAEPPRRIAMPDRKQGEALCYGADGKTLYATSEKLPTPLWRVPVVESGHTADSSE